MNEIKENIKNKDTSFDFSNKYVILNNGIKNHPTIIAPKNPNIRPKILLANINMITTPLYNYTLKSRKSQKLVLFIIKLF